MGVIFSAPVNSFKRLTGRYVLTSRLLGHTDAITCVSLSKDGNVLASGGYDGLRLWDMKLSREISAPPQRMYNDAISAVAWVVPDDAYLTLCYATSLGMLIFCREAAGQQQRFEEILAKRLGSGTAITCIATGTSDRAATRLATASRDGLVQAWVFTLPNKLENTFSLNFANTIPIGLAFVNNAGESENILFFDLVNGNMHVLNGKTGIASSSKQLGGLIGHVAVSNPLFVIDSVSNGFALYEADTGKYLRTFSTPARARTLPRQVTFGEGGKVIVGGSDNGVVAIYDRGTAALLETFKPTKGLLQTVQTHWTKETSTIIAASTALKSDNTIWVWTRKGGRADRISWRENVWSALKWIFKSLVLLAALGFVVQNTKAYTESVKAEIVRAADLRTQIMLMARGWEYPDWSRNAPRYVIDDHIANFEIPSPGIFKWQDDDE